jgi:hypothetical protein
VESLAEFGGDFVDLVILVNGYSLMGGIEDDAAVLASGGMGADFIKQPRAEFVVEVVGEMR